MKFEGYLPEVVNQEAWEKYKNHIEMCWNKPIYPRDIPCRHHIVPKCFLQTNAEKRDSDNLITISFADHVEAHRLLAEAFNTNGLNLAYALLTKDKEHIHKCRSIASAKGAQKLAELRKQSDKPYHTEKWYKEHTVTEEKSKEEASTESWESWVDSIWRG